VRPPAGGHAAAGYDLLVCDLDGTLIGDSMTLEPPLVQAFHRAAGRGLAISIATGRMPAAADRYRDELGITAPVIYYNGALVRGGNGSGDLVSLTLPRGILARAWAVFSQAPVHPIFYRDEQLFCVEKTFAVRRYCDEEGLRAEVVDDPAAFLELGAFIKALLIGHPRDLDVVRQELTPIVGEHGRLVRTRGDYLEIIPLAASKGAALSRLAAHLHVPLPRVVAVGDQENDLEMLREAGLGVAMPHAPEPVRRAADRIAPGGADGGLLALFGRSSPVASTDLIRGASPRSLAGHRPSARSREVRADDGVARPDSDPGASAPPFPALLPDPARRARRPGGLWRRGRDSRRGRDGGRARSGRQGG
jgi:Cof subfamily protein (haloacid dehalogenase superfamily)